MNKKIRKLINNPRQYFHDYFEKNFGRIKNSYSIITCNYNNSSYIDDFFESILPDFEDDSNKIEIIVVDDHSTDNSKEVLHKWQIKHPNQIKLIFNEENKGVSFSRNRGLDLAKNDWVSFIDIDDFFSKRFFKHLDFYITKTRLPLGIIFLPVVEHYPSREKAHPLNYRFKTKNNVIKIKEFNDITQSSTTTLFKRDLIEKKRIRFDERIKTTFEDGKFELEVMLSNPDSYLGLFNEGQYYYRKKLNSNSVSHSAWQKKEKYYTDLKYGFELFDQYTNTTYLPKKCLYELFWYIKYLLNKPVEKYVQNEQIESLFQRLFSYIPSDVIKSYSRCGCWTPYKIGMLGRYKNMSFTWHSCYVEEYDDRNYQLKIAIYYYYASDLGQVEVNGHKAEIKHEKTQVFYLFDAPFYYKKICWISFKPEDRLGYIEPECKTKYANISCGKLNVRRELSCGQILANLRVNRKVSLVNKVLSSYYRVVSTIYGYNNCWLFMDRDIWADDSAEVLFKWIWEKKPEYRKRIFFAANSNTADYKRLKESGLNVIPFNTVKFRSCLQECFWFISSQADSYQLRGVINPKFKYAFLQHGIIKDNISNWLNNKKIDLFITSTDPEFKYVSGDGPFKFTTKEVKCLGLPRHDLLINKNMSRGQIVIMPTWRKSLSADSTTSNEKFINPEFFNSEFAIKWKSLLHSNLFKELAQKGVNIVFCPHVNLTVYMDWFELPAYFHEFKAGQDGEIRQLFNESNVMITDSSSAAFEMAYLNKQVIYYQFDMDKMWNGEHTASRGYFDYNKNGFGPVCLTEQDVLRAIEKAYKSDWQIEKKYKCRFEIYPKNKKSSCELVFNELYKAELK